MTGLALQLLTGLASASSLFLVAVGLSLIFGVMRIVNFAHGSFFMLGIYLAYSLVSVLGGSIGYWVALPLAAVIVGAFGALVEIFLLRRIYRSPELFQLLATFAVVLVVKDAALIIWGPEELLGPRAPGLEGAVQILGQPFPAYDLFLLVVGPAVLAGLWWLMHRTNWGRAVRAATEDREMVAALGIHQAWLFTAVFALGTGLAGLGGALQLPREPASLELDLTILGSAFVVVVVGGMGSLAGAFVAAIVVSVVKALCIWVGVVTVFGIELAFPKLTLVAEFLVMAAVLIWRPWGLFGKPQSAASYAAPEEPWRLPSTAQRTMTLVALAVAAAMPVWSEAFPYAVVLATDMAVAVLFAASLHLLMGPAGMHSFGHAAYYGLGAYGAALLVTSAGLPMPLALAMAPLAATLGALLFGWFSVRLSGVYLAMLTLAFAQIVWSIAFQWDAVTGGSNGIIGLWPVDWLSEPNAYYWLALGCMAAGIWVLRRVLFSPFGYALRAARDSGMRAQAIGIDVHRIQWMGFVVTGTVAGLAGALFAFSKGSIAPDVLGVAQSINGLVMVMLGGVQTLAGPVVGASTFVWLSDTVSQHSAYWRAALGAVILLLVLLFPRGLAGYGQMASGLLKQRGGS
ncbi:MAG: ABC transporter permease [Burkholderiaceae bacterium]|nr:ABC transporter permease [Burkholderiaceae bacterium]MCD8565519.1 ABC transporter permease [Burkholderiaceae bacterium]